MEEDITSEMPFYTRFIDDIFSLCTRRQADTFIDAFNRICPDIQLDESSITRERDGVFLDMNLFIKESGTIGYRIYQKDLNIYQYIPPFSAHSKHVFNAFILNEFKRYRLMCSEDSDYNAQVSRFYMRLLQRGYSDEEIHEARILVPPRSEILVELFARRERHSAASVVTHQINKTRPILVACLPTFHRIHGLESKPFDFSLPKLTQIPDNLMSLPQYQKAFVGGPVLLAHKNLPNIGRILVKSRYHP
jgi:hypothetical protein